MDDQPKEAYQNKTESARAIRVSSEHFSGLLSEAAFHVWYYQGRTPMETFLEGKKYFQEKNLETIAA